VNEDTLTVTYIDADDGQGNFDVPVSSTRDRLRRAGDLERLLVGRDGHSAVIQWLTTTRDSVVHYGPAIPPGLTTRPAPRHRPRRGPDRLSACSDYYYSVESVDAHAT